MWLFNSSLRQLIKIHGNSKKKKRFIRGIQHDKEFQLFCFYVSNRFATISINMSIHKKTIV